MHLEHKISDAPIMKHASLKKIVHFFIPFLLWQAALNPALADTADGILKLTDSQIMSTAKQMADAVSRNAPSTIDRSTTLLGAIFVSDTKTFIYKYESTTALDGAKMPSYIAHHTCSSRIRKSFMLRGITFKHVYITPTGEQATSVRYKDCL